MFSQTNMNTPFGMSQSQYFQKNIFSNSNFDFQSSPSSLKLEREPILSLAGIGDPIVDISAEIDYQTVKKYGLEWGRTVYVDEKTIGIFNELEKKDQVSYIPGGSAQNSIRVLAKIINKNENTKNKRKSKQYNKRKSPPTS